MNGFQYPDGRTVPKEAEEPQGKVKGLRIPDVPTGRGDPHREQQQRENLCPRTRPAAATVISAFGGEVSDGGVWDTLLGKSLYSSFFDTLCC